MPVSIVCGGVSQENRAARRRPPLDAAGGGRAWPRCAGVQTWGSWRCGVVLAPRLRDAAVGAGVAAVTALALFLPFMLGGHFAMLSFEWHVFSPSPMSLFVAAGTPFGWPLRLVQATVAVAVGAAVARLLRHSPHALWAAPLAIVAARLQSIRTSISTASPARRG